MATTNRVWLRTAEVLQAQMLGSIQNSFPPLPAEGWQRVVDIARRISLADRCSWRRAAQRQTELLREGIEELQTSLARTADVLRIERKQELAAAETDFYRDLAALHREFDESLQCTPDAENISVTTCPIVLEDIPLGRFEIRLQIKQFPIVQQFKVFALEPHPASSDTSIVHPHINGEALCTGDGRKAIESALEAGRLYDFFTVVNRLLHTYSEGRAYVELSNWYGVPCHDCNCTVDEDDHYCCHDCEEKLCSNCGNLCSHCDQLYCSNCSASCPRCNCLVCAGCLKRCCDCRHEVCPEP